MSKLQRQEDEMYEVGYVIEILPNCRTCNHHHGQIYGGVELVCAVHPYGYSGDSCPNYQAKKRLQVTGYFSQNNNTQARLTAGFPLIN